MKKLCKRLIAALMCVVMVVGSGTAIFAATPTAAPRLYDLDVEVGFNILPLNADGDAIDAVSEDIDGDSVKEEVYADVEKLSLSFTGTLGEEYIVYLLYNDKVPSETSIRYMDQSTCTDTKMSFVVTPTQMAQTGTYYVYVASDIYTLVGTFTVADKETVAAGVTYVDADGKTQTAYAATLQAAIAQAKALTKAGVESVTVKLLSDSTVTGMIIPSGVTLDLADSTLTADYVVGLNGSYLIANANSGKLSVPEGSLVLPEEGYISGTGKDGSTQYILPIWDPNQNCYLFSLFVANTNNDDRGLKIDAENETIYFQFKHQATGDINSGLLADGASDNALKIIVRLVWNTGDGEAYQDFVYNDAFVGDVAKLKGAQARDYTFKLTGYSTLNIDLDTLSVTAMIVSDSGATAFGDVWTKENAK